MENLLEGIEARPDIDYLGHKEKLDALDIKWSDKSCACVEHENR